MLIDIDKIVVGDRIRKDFGDIDELAEDIRQNGLINPPVVNKEYQLLAGERRLRACKSLGWQQIEVRMMDTRDAEHELNVEISENDVRKGFTKSERVDYMWRLLRIQQAKAKERMSDGGRGVEIDAPLQRSDEATAKQFGVSASTMRREMAIVDHADLLDPADFADWDEGRLSTNKAFNKIKEAKARAEREKALAEKERDAVKSRLAEAYHASELLETQLAMLKRQAAESQKPQIVEREIVKEVAPSDYEATKRKAASLKRDNERLNREYQEMWRKKQEAERKLEQANELLGESSRNDSAQRDIEHLTIATNTYLRNYGGKAWAFDQFYRVDEVTRDEFIKAITNLAAFAQNLAQMVTEKSEQE